MTSLIPAAKQSRESCFHGASWAWSADPSTCSACADVCTCIHAAARRDTAVSHPSSYTQSLPCSSSAQLLGAARQQWQNVQRMDKTVLNGYPPVTTRPHLTCPTLCSVSPAGTCVRRGRAPPSVWTSLLGLSAQCVCYHNKDTCPPSPLQINQRFSTTALAGSQTVCDTSSTVSQLLRIRATPRENQRPVCQVMRRSQPTNVFLIHLDLKCRNLECYSRRLKDAPSQS